jgi:hypothetical protein
MMECEAKAPDISHMDVLYDEIDDITLSQVCQANSARTAGKAS